MKKSTRIVKKLLALFLVVLMSINTMGAVVGDNDGSAFITKAEFDSLKNNFQSQIDQYNTSIESKIDGAIASYLSGVRIAKESKVGSLVNNYGEIKWINNFKTKIGLVTYTGIGTGTQDPVAWTTFPHDARRVLRYGQIFLMFNFASLRPMVMYMSFSLADGDHPFMSNGGSGNSNKTCSVDFLDLGVNEGAPKWSDEATFKREACMNRNIHCENNYGTTTFTKDDGTLEQGFRVIGSLDGLSGADPVMNPIGANEVINLDIPIVYLYGQSYTNGVHSRADNCTMHISQSADDVVYPPEYSVHTAAAPVRWTTDGETYGERVLDDCHQANWVSDANRNQHVELFKTAMCGRDDVSFVNVNRYKEKLKYGQERIPVTENSIFVPTSFKLTTVELNGVQQWSDAGSMPWSGSIDATLAIPLFETVRFRDFLLPQFVTSTGNTLKAGSGIPLVLDSYESGVSLDVSFKYSINRIIDSAGTENRLYVELKKSNFIDTENTEESDFYRGYVNDDQEKLIKDYVVNDKDKKVHIVIDDIPQESDVWLRVAPVNDEGGYYAEISDLEVKKIDNT